MTVALGLDIGTNSVGSAWIDTEKEEMTLGVSVFPAGVEESDDKRGTPKNQARRSKRSQRRNIRRRAQRKSQLRKTLISAGLLPSDEDELRKIFGPCRTNAEREAFALERKWNPWHLRRDGMLRPLSPYEYGRVLVHLNQRRGALGVDFSNDGEEPDTGAIKKAYQNLRSALIQRYATDEEERQRIVGCDDEEFQHWLYDNNITIGRFMADEYDRRTFAMENSRGQEFVSRVAIRNRRDMLLAQNGRALHADRSLIVEEFERLWQKQKAFNSPLSSLLTEELRAKLYSAERDETWRAKGDIFGQRDTYWDAGTLGRCDLEPTDHQCPIGDMYAQEFGVLETVNRIKVERRGETPRPLTVDERQLVIDVLSKQKTATYKSIRTALGLNNRASAHL